MSRPLEFEVDEQSEIIDAVKASRVSQLFVEFLQQGGPKPHVVLRLNIDPVVQVGHETYMGCRLTMDLEGGLHGIFHISPLPYDDASHAAHAAFEFKLKVSHWTVDNVLAGIVYPNDLLDFSFTGDFRVPGDTTEYVDGCRDFISQVFIILHKTGFVGWHVHKIDKGVFDSTNLLIREDRTGFHEIIGKNYSHSTEESGPTIVTSLPLARGTFHDKSFCRILRYQIDNQHQCQIPYGPEDPQEGDFGYISSILWSDWIWRESYFERYRIGPDSEPLYNSDGKVIYEYYTGSQE